MTESYQEATGWRERGQWKLWLLMILAAAPLLAALLMYFGGLATPEGRTNKGHLILPPLEGSLWGLSALREKQAALQQEDGKGKWVILIVGAGDCLDRCEESLYLTRQVNIAVGRDANRVTRVLLSAPDMKGLAPHLHEHPNLIQMAQREDAWGGLLRATAEHEIELEAFDILLMDPLDNIMMHYGAEHDGRALLEDLKRLLKVSKIG